MCVVAYGPGGSSLFGLFNENGPLVVDKDNTLSARNITWNSIYHMIYIDNPVCKTNSCMGRGTLML